MNKFFQAKTKCVCLWQFQTKILPKQRITNFLLTIRDAAPIAFCKIPNNMKLWRLDMVAMASLWWEDTWNLEPAKTLNVPQPKSTCEVPNKKLRLPYLHLVYSSGNLIKHPENVPCGLSPPSPGIMHSSVATNNEEHRKNTMKTHQTVTLLLTNAESLKKVSHSP